MANRWQNNIATPVMRSSDDSVAMKPGGDMPLMESGARFGRAVEPPAGNGARRRRWLLIAVVLVLLAVTAGLVTFFVVKGNDSSDASTSGGDSSADKTNTTQPSASGTGSGSGAADDEVGNPKAYPKSVCQLPNYESKNGHIVAVAANGTEVNLKMKGVNWFGMEANEAVPLGLWDNGVNGTTAFKIAELLAQNKFNAVRLPLMAQAILDNTKPNANIINTYTNRALDVTDYMSLVQSVVKALQFRSIGVMISMHTLTKNDKGSLWFNAEVTEEKFLESIDMLTKALCSDEYWNVMGIDVKNEPWGATWGDDSPNDFRAGAKRIADRMLAGCPKWLGFIEGISTQHETVLDGEKYWYSDWYGGGLQGAKTQGIELSVANKVVWAPHYYTPAVFPQSYLFGGGSLGDENSKGENGLMGFVELEDDVLRGRVQATTDEMFGFLASETGPAVVMGEFGGIYATDSHPKKTTKRTTDYTIEIITRAGWAGGFVWSLNPESEYQYNPADKPGRFFEGLLEMDWLRVNTEFLNGLAAMDTMENLRPFPCFPLSSS